jgi:ATP-dependent helicase/nuclease subunit A
MSEILDQEARDLVVGKLEQSFSLTAGAGSGKTSVLVQRLIRVLSSGVPPRRVGAITFTEKAAGELRYRARRGLEDVLASTTDAEHAATVKSALDAFSELTLSTIHAFCRELLVMESLTAGFAPATAAAED